MRITALSALLLAEPALAAEPRWGENVRIGPETTVEDDLYVTGGDVEIRGPVTGDLVVMAGTARLAGRVDGDVLALGGTTTLTGPVQGTVRAAGGTLVIAAPVQEDLVVAGGTVELLPDGIVGRDALVAGGTVDLEGPITGDVWAAAGDLAVNGTIGGDLRAETGMLRVGADAAIGGDLVYAGDEATIAPQATIRGDVERRIREQTSPGEALMIGVVDWLRTLVGLFVLGLLFVWLVPAFARRSTTTLRERPWASLGIGAGVLIGVPILAAFVFVVGLLLGGWWIAAIALGLLGVCAALALDVAGLFVGRRILERGGRRVAPAWALLLGLALILLVGAIPFAGPLVVLAAALFGLGALAAALVRARPPMPWQDAVG